MKKIAIDTGRYESREDKNNEYRLANSLANKLQKVIMQNESIKIPDIVAMVISSIDAKGIRKPLMDKIYFANDNRFDVYISINCQTNLQQKTDGFNIYYDHKNNSIAIKSKKLANSVSESLKKFGFKHLGKGIDTPIAVDNLAVCSYTMMPSILLEISFICNLQDNKNKNKIQSDFAEAVYQGIVNFFA